MQINLQLKSACHRHDFSGACLFKRETLRPRSCFSGKHASRAGEKPREAPDVAGDVAADVAGDVAADTKIDILTQNIIYHLLI